MWPRTMDKVNKNAGASPNLYSAILINETCGGKGGTKENVEILISISLYFFPGEKVLRSSCFSTKFIRITNFYCGLDPRYFIGIISW